jgi:ParB-like chromosome segregation protein Spo0J
MRQPDVEEWLGDIETRWRYEVELDLKLVDEKASLRNQARIEPLDPDVVERYEADMRRGDYFPPIIVREKNSRLVVLGGNHRYTAAKRAKRPLPAYIVDCTDEQALRIAYEDNRRHGLPPSPAERIRQAQHLVALGYTQAAAAKLVGITENRLQRAIAADEFGRRCRTLEVVPVPEHLPETTKARLMALRADPVFIDAVDLANDADLPTDAVYKLVTDCNKARSEAAARDHVRNARALNADLIARKQAGDGRRNAAKGNARSRLARSLTEVCLLDPADVTRATLPDQRRAMFDHIRRAVAHLEAIDTELRR